MPIKRTTSTHSVSKPRRDWPHLMSKIAYLCAALAIVLVFVQINLYCWRFNRVYDTSVVTAVTMANGQTYFGRLQKYGPHTLVLFDVYYLQVGENATDNTTTDAAAEVDTAAATTDSNIKLVKLADDFYKPNSYVILNRDQMVYWQQLSNDSPILDAIDNYENSDTN